MEGPPGCCVVLGRDDSGSGDREKGRASGCLKSRVRGGMFDVEIFLKEGRIKVGLDFLPLMVVGTWLGWRLLEVSRLGQKTTTLLKVPRSSI